MARAEPTAPVEVPEDPPTVDPEAPDDAPALPGPEAYGLSYDDLALIVRGLRGYAREEAIRQHTTAPVETVRSWMRELKDLEP